MYRRMASMLVLLPMVVHVYGQNNYDSLEKYVDSVFMGFSGTKTPGCAVAIIAQGKLVFEKGYGMANLECGAPVTPKTIFDVASVSKQFTGFAISTLIQSGKISPDDDVHKYLPELPDFGKKITISNLLHHTSGLRDWPEGLHIAGWRWEDPIYFEDIIRMVYHQKQLDFDPGSRFSYSNTGYNLLAAIVEKVTGAPLKDWEEQNIFKPFGMEQSGIRDNYGSIINGRAVSYYAAGNGFNASSDALMAYGSSSLFTSVEDLSKWVIHFQQSVKTGDPVYERMIQTGQLGDSQIVHYGYGLEVNDRQGIKIISHDGGWAGYHSIIINYPQRNISFIILSNADRFDPTRYAAAISMFYFGDIFKEEAAAEDLSSLPTVKVVPPLLQKYTGSFQLATGWYVTFTSENGQLMVQATGEDKVVTEAKSDSVFWVPQYKAYFTFPAGGTGKVSEVKYRYHHIVAPRVTPSVITPQQLHEFAGSYYSEEFETGYRITVDKNKLILHHMRLGDIAAEPDLVIKDLFHCGLGALKFYRNGSEKVVGYRLSGGRVKNIEFHKE